MEIPERFDKYLLDEEHVALALTYHWAFLGRRTLWLVGALVLSYWVLTATGGSRDGWTVAAIALLPTGLAFAAGWEERANVRFIVTENRAIYVTGWIAKRYGMMPLSKITDLTFEQSVLGRVFGYGTLVAESAGQDQAFSRVPFLPRPEVTWRELSQLLYEEGAVRSSYRPRAQRMAEQRARDADLAPEPTNPLRRPPGRRDEDS